MTATAFKSNVRSYWRSELQRGVIFLCLMGMAAIVTISVFHRIDLVGYHPIAGMVILVSYAAIACGMFYVLAPMRRKHLRKLDAFCPQCRRMLLGKYSNAVIETGRCPECGSQVLQ